MNQPTLTADLAAHQDRVARIAEEVKGRAQARASGQAQDFASLGKEAVSHFVPNPHDPRHRDRKINVRDLNHLLELDVANRRCVAEPGLTFHDLVAATLPHGLLPKLVPELKTITIGGAVSGCSVESMSYKYGGFHDSCLAYEVISGTGEVLSCSRQQDPLLFHMLHGSYGTLGILTRLTFELIPAKPYVRLEYPRFDTFEAFHAAMRVAMQAPDIDFIDGIIHGPDCFVLCLGRFVDDAPFVSDYTWLDIYYKSTRTRREDYLATADYLFRYDTECHWLTKSLPGMESKVLRWLLGRWVLGSTQLIHWSNRLRPLLKHQAKPEVVVDLFIPHRQFPAFFQWYAQDFDYYPLWIVPYRMARPYPWISDQHAARLDDDLFIDCAIYGKRNNVPGIDFHRVLEDKTFQLNGIKTLISKNHYSEERFWQIYDRPRYQAIKTRMDPHNLFRDLYHKFHA